MDWDRVEFVARVVLVPVIFIASAGALWYGAIMVMFAEPLGKLLGLTSLLLSLGGWIAGLWWAFGRPRHWFEPGRNTEYDPRR